MAFPMGSPLTLQFLHIPVASWVQNREIQAPNYIWYGLSYGPFQLTLEFLHISKASWGQNREIQATKDFWYGLSYGLPTNIAISPYFKKQFQKNMLQKTVVPKRP